VEHIGNLLLIFKLLKQKSVYGVSIDSQIMLLIATMSRFVFVTDTQIPSIFLGPIELVLAALLHIYIVY